jgi:hypothetical protein
LRTATACSTQASSKAADFSPSGSHTIVRLRFGHLPPLLAQGVGEGVASIGDLRRSVEHGIPVAQRFESAGLADVGHAEGDDGFAQTLDDRRVCHGVADAQPRQTVGLGEGAQQHEVRIVPDEVEAAHPVGDGGELPIGFVEGDEDMCGHPIEERAHLGIAQHRTRRVVR